MIVVAKTLPGALVYVPAFDLPPTGGRRTFRLWKRPPENPALYPAPERGTVLEEEPGLFEDREETFCRVFAYGEERYVRKAEILLPRMPKVRTRQ